MQSLTCCLELFACISVTCGKSKQINNWKPCPRTITDLCLSFLQIQITITVNKHSLTVLICLLQSVPLSCSNLTILEVLIVCSSQTAHQKAKSALENQAKHIDNHEVFLQKYVSTTASGSLYKRLRNRVLDIDDKLGTLSSPVAAPLPIHANIAARELDIRPEYFEGKPDHCNEVLLRCQLAFSRSDLFPTWVSSALCWSRASLQSHSVETLSLKCFLQEFSTIPSSRRKRQRPFCPWSKEGRSWQSTPLTSMLLRKKLDGTNDALRGTFVNSFSEQIKDQLSSCDEPEWIDQLVYLYWQSF